MWVWIIVGVVTVAAGVFAFWPRAGGLDARVNRASTLAHGRADEYGGPGSFGDASGGDAGGS